MTDKNLNDGNILEVKPGLPRRQFLGIIGASMALAGATTTGCIRRPKEYIYPEDNRVENALPGVPQFYASAAQIGGGVLGLLVTSTDGRPTKIDGNFRHIMNNPIPTSKIGSSNAFAQAEILNLYDPDRGQKCLHLGKELSSKDAFKALQKVLGESKTRLGKDLALVVPTYSSPTFTNLVSDFKLSFPESQIFEQNTTYSENRKNGLSQIVNSSVDALYDLTKANVILAVDSDFLGIESDNVKYAREFASKRKLEKPTEPMNRLYSVESNFSITGTTADHHYVLSNLLLGDFLISLARELIVLGLTLPSELSKLFTTKSNLNSETLKWLKIVAKDIYSQKGKSVVIVGDKQQPWLHALGFAINSALGAVHSIVELIPDTTKNLRANSLTALKTALETHKIQTLVVIDGNPVYATEADLNFKNLFSKVPNSFYLGYFNDETAHECKFYFPKTHFLESWGDLQSTDGTVSIRQPLIAPLYDECQDEYSFLYSLSHSESSTGYSLVKQYWQLNLGNPTGFENNWRSYLSDGIVNDTKKLKPFTGSFSFAFVQAEYAKLPAYVAPSKNSLNIEFSLDRSVYDGRYSNNAWMQELPDPIHKLVWDNALLINSKTAALLGLNGKPKPGKKEVDLVKLTYKNRTLEVAVWEVPGIADFTGVIQLGYGRKFGIVATDCGFNANLIRTSDSWFGSGVTIEKTGKLYSLVTSQMQASLSGTPGVKEDRPPVVRETTLADYIKNPNFVSKYELIPVSEQKSNLYSFPKDPDQTKWARQQWGMSIDLNSCTGCNACTVACQAENNIAVVGKNEVFKNREMSWIRLDRYFTGDVDNPEVRAVFQPLNCQHCENAPCEAVCPVTATSHSPDGLNDMTYNRCVGTRYCANNCPYKVRRFNFLSYSKDEDERNPLYAMQKNPNVTVRFRGVMEKCTYCVQKINTARVKAAKNSNGLVPDGAIVTACQSVCPTQAIVFGDIADPLTEVSKMKSQSRNYALLGELNTKPRTTYLAKIRNTNSELS